MKAVRMTGAGGVEVLGIGDHPDPLTKPDELLVGVRATALNRADLLQRRGKYPPWMRRGRSILRNGSRDSPSRGSRTAGCVR